MTDRLASEIEGIRTRAAQITDDGHDVRECTADLGGPCAGHDAARLADAVEAMLAPHKPGRWIVFGDTCGLHASYRHFSITGTEAASVEACERCTATVYVSCAGCGPQVRLDSCPTVAAITVALLGEEGT